MSEEGREKLLTGQSPSSLNNAAKKESSFQVDLRVHGVSQDDICEDEERMTKMQTLVDRLKDGFHDKSIIEDLKPEDVSVN